ncbi:MAG TPA: glycoside hydrolase family 3 N-terminal domain-containing protein [Gemmatimonadales bacterium]|nr:glycoside hydrolase family 3 N-terminal domain-containing protein [Gemmatimonadales bacterium]
MTASLARLVFPALRWRRGSFAHERAKIDQALAAGVGGFIVFGGTREAVATLTSELRRQAARPLLIGADLERGAGQQVRGLTELPPAAALGALDDLDATHAAALITATEALSVGLNWAFAPVCDLDVEPENPIIQTRSFGADPQRVGEQAAVWVHGCQEHGVLACAKHYPGHGRTTQDSHATVPRVATPFAELAEQDLGPFEFAIRAAVGSMMAAYVAYPGWDASGRAAAFSPTILGYLRDPLNFSGFVVTDALIMGGATATQAEAPATVSAVAAGCDGLLYPEDFAGVIAALDAAVGKEIPSARADEALARYDRTIGEWGRGKGEGDLDLAANAKFGDQLAGRALRWVRGEKPLVRTTVNVTVVDDDAGGPYTVGSRAVFSAELRAHGKRITDKGQRIVAVFANPLSWKGHADLSARSRAALRRLVPGAALVVLFGHPRLAAQVPGRAPLLCAWGGDAVMQRAAARAISGD